MQKSAIKSTLPVWVLLAVFINRHVYQYDDGYNIASGYVQTGLDWV
jgi:hypothetical protein